MLFRRITKPLFVAGWCLASLSLLGVAWRANPYDQAIAWHTVCLGLLAATVSIPLGSALAWVSLGDRALNRVMLFCTACLLAVPVFLHVSTWDAAFGRLGWLTSTEGQALKPLISGWTAASWIHGVAAAPQVAVILLIGLSFRQQTIEEHGLLETTRWNVFLHLRLRRMWPLFLLSLLWTIVAAAREIAATDLYQIGSLAEQIYLGYSLGQFNAIVGGWSPEDLLAAAQLNFALAIVILAWLAATSALVCFQFIGQEQEVDPRSVLGLHAQRDVLESNRIRILKQLCAGGLILLLLLIPLGNLLVRCCFYVTLIDGKPTPGYAIEQLGGVLQRSFWNYQREFFWSVVIGVTASSVIMLASTVWVWVARTSKLASVMLGFSWVISCTIPGPLIGTLVGGLFQLVDWPGVTYLSNRTIAAPTLATICFCWPFPPLIVWFIFRNVPRDLIDQARLDGAGEWRIFGRFGILDHLPKLFGCWLVAFALCLGDLSASHLVLPPGMDTLPRLMLGLLHAGVDEMTAGITIVLIVMIGLISLVGWKMIHSNWGRSPQTDSDDKL